MFFKPAVDLLLQSGHSVLCTSRQYREAVELARINGLDIKIAGEHGGAERYDKLAASAKRILELGALVKGFGPEVAVNFSSPEGARVAFGLGIKQLVFNDSPHAEAVARLTIPLADHLLCPWVIPYRAWERFGISRKKITMYHALDPVAWLKRSSSEVGKRRSKDAKMSGQKATPQSIKLPIPKFLKEIKESAASSGKKIILIRLEEAKASYIADRKLASVDMIDALVEALSESARLLVLCRYQDQIEQVAKRYRGQAYVIREVVNGTVLISQSDIFIGAGGTMTAEAALMGKPTVSIAPVRYYVEKYLLDCGLVRRANSANGLTKLVSEMVTDRGLSAEQKKRADYILDSMEDPIEVMVTAIKNASKRY
jgi:predicted glycosyltransferase